MGYELQDNWTVLPGPEGLTIDLTAAAGTKGTYRPHADLYLYGIGAAVHTADVAGATTLPKIAVSVVDSDGSSNKVQVAEIVFTTGDDVGDRRLEWIAGAPILVDVSAGRMVIIETTQAATGGGAAGNCDAHVFAKIAGRAETYKDV